MLEKLHLLAFLSHLGSGAVSQCCREQLDVAPNPSEQGPGGHHPQAPFPLSSLLFQVWCWWHWGTSPPSPFPTFLLVPGVLQELLCQACGHICGCASPAGTQGVVPEYRLLLIAGLTCSSQPWHIPCPSCLPASVGGLGRPDQSFCHPVSPWGCSPPPLHPQKPSTTPVWGSSLHSQRDWDQLVGKSCFQPSWLGLGLGRLLCCTPNPLGWEGCANQCLPCRAQRSWLPGLRTLLLAPLLSYLSVPFLVRLFPSVLTKFVYLNFREYPSQEKPHRDSAGCCRPPKTRVGPCQDSIIQFLLCCGLAEEAQRESFPVFCKL